MVVLSKLQEVTGHASNLPLAVVLHWSHKYNRADFCVGRICRSRQATPQTRR